MQFLDSLAPETISLLWRIYRHSQHHRVRQRAHCLLLKAEGFSLPQLLSIFQVSRKTIYNWFNAWQQERFVGLYERPGRGRKPSFTPEQRDEIRQWTKAHPNNLKQVLQRVEQDWGMRVSQDTIKRVLKAFALSWRRLRRVVASQPSAEEYQRKAQHLEQLKAQAEQHEIDLRYLDETGFCLLP